MEKEESGTGAAAKAAPGTQRQLYTGLVQRDAYDRTIPDLNRRIDNMRQGNWQFTREVVRRVLRRHAAQARADGDAEK